MCLFSHVTFVNDPASGTQVRFLLLGCKYLTSIYGNSILGLCIIVFLVGDVIFGAFHSSPGQSTLCPCDNPITAYMSCGMHLLVIKLGREIYMSGCPSYSFALVSYQQSKHNLVNGFILDLSQISMALCFFVLG